jgi:hypothetical protein
MAQIIKHRRGSVDSLASATAKKGELVMATGSVGNMNGPWIFVGETEGSAGAFRTLSKIYQGSSAPDLTGGTYGSTLNGTPFYGSTNQSLYILSNAGNVTMDLTGNIEGNVISGVTINNLTGTTIDISSNLTVGGDTTLSGDLTITGLTENRLVVVGVDGLIEDDANLVFDGSVFQIGQGQFEVDVNTGELRTSGSIIMKGNITIGDNQGGDIIDFNGEVSSSIIPSGSNLFDLGSPTNAWKDLYVSGTAYIENITIGDVSLNSLELPGDLTVSGTTTLSGSVFVDGLTQGRVVFVGTDGELIDNENFTYDPTNGFLLNTSGSILINTSGSLEMKTENGDNIFLSSSDNLNFEAADDINITAGDDIRIYSNDIFSLRNYSVDESIELITKYDSGDEKTLSFDVDGNLTIPGGFTGSFANIDTQAQLASAAVEDLTENRIVVVGVDGELEDDANFTFDGTTFNVGQGNFEVDTLTGDIRTSGSFTIENGLTVNGDLNVTEDLNVTGTTIMYGDLYVSGNVEFLASSSYVYISSSVVELDDNIIRLNAYSPFERYAGFEVIDSGSTGVSASLVWDGLNDYWMFVSSSGESSKLIGTTAGAYGSETSLTETYFPIATGLNTIGDSLLRYSGTTLSFNTNKFTIDSGTGDTTISGGITLSYSGGTDNGNNTSGIVFKNSNNLLGFVSTTETEDVLDGILGYKNSDGALVFSTVIDGGTY